MKNTHLPVIIDNETGDILNDEELANQTASDVFDNEENAQKTGNVISIFVDSYTRHKNTLPLDVWGNEAERYETALAVIKTVQEANDSKADLYAHLDKGKSRESWLAKKIEQGANAAGVVEVGKYVQNIDIANTS